jgi:hypothetical protein
VNQAGAWKALQRSVMHRCPGSWFVEDIVC